MNGIACPKCGGFAVWLVDPDTGQDGFLCDSCGAFDCPVCGEWHAERQPPLVLTDDQRVAVWRLLTDEILEAEGQRVWHGDLTGAEGLREVADAIRSGRGIR